MWIGRRSTAFVLWALLAVSAAVATQKAGSERNQKLVQLRKLALGSSNYIVEMDSKMYETFVEQSPRPYTVIILFYSANNEASEEVHREYIFAAGHWRDKETHFTQLHGGKEFRRPIFFAAVKFSQDTMRIFRDLDLRGVPDVLVSTPQEVSFRDPLERKMYQRQFLWEIQPSDGIITAKKLVLWLADKTQTKVVYRESLWTFLESMVYFVILVLVLGLIYSKQQKYIFHPVLWLVVYFVGYYVACAGIVYCILNNARWVGEKDGQPEYIDPSSRSQFVSEGLIMSAASRLSTHTVCGVGIFWVVFTKVATLVKSQVVQKIVYAVILFFVWFLMHEVEVVFGSKNSYHPNFNPPAHYKRGSLRLDQGHSV